MQPNVNFKIHTEMEEIVTILIIIVIIDSSQSNL